MTEERATSMNRKVFTMGLSLESTSAYLLCCALADSATTISTRHLLDIWNGSAEQLKESLQTLEQRGILRRILSDAEGNAAFQLGAVADWLPG